MIIYFIGVIIAVFLIGRALCKRNTGEEYSGDILCYLFALASWAVVVILVVAEIREYFLKK